MTQQDGASFEEQILSVPNLDNLSLFKTIEQQIGSNEVLSSLINKSKNIQGQPLLYLLCYKAAWDTLNSILDSETIDLDISVVTDRDGDSCIHGLLLYILEEQDMELGRYILENLIECGFDINIKNKKGLNPLDFYLERNGGKADEIVDLLISAGFNGGEEQGNEGEEVEESDAE